MSRPFVARRRSASRPALSNAAAAGALLLLAAAAGAQAVPSTTGATGAARKAAEAANRRTEATSGAAVSGTQQQPQTAQKQRATAAQPQTAQQQRGDTASRAAQRGTAGQSRGSVSVTERGGRGELTLQREVFDYDPSGRRDPFVSLMASGELRPIISDLQLKSIIYDATGRNSVAVLRDAQTKDQYRVRVGQTLGRMRVTAIRPREVVFTIDEFGFNRQEVLTYSDPAPRKP